MSPLLCRLPDTSIHNVYLHIYQPRQKLTPFPPSWINGHNKDSLICTQKFTLTFHTLTKILSKVVLHVKMQKNHTVFSQLSAALTSVQLTIYWTSPPFCFVTAVRRFFHYKIAFFIVWSSISFHFVFAFSRVQVWWLCVHARQCAITSS